jgi:hypothetical protein
VSGTSGTVDAASPVADLDLTLTVTGGTPSCFEKATGEIRLSGSQSLESSPTSGTGSGEVTGSTTGALQRRR